SSARRRSHRVAHVAYEDVTSMAIPVLRHRILLNFHAESDRIDSDEILRQLLQHMPPPSKACVARTLLAVRLLQSLSKGLTIRGRQKVTLESLVRRKACHSERSEGIFLRGC